MTEKKTSESKLKSNAAYEAKQGHFHLRFVQSADMSVERVRECADAAGESVNAYIVRAIRERMEREGAGV